MGELQMAHSKMDSGCAASVVEGGGDGLDGRALSRASAESADAPRVEVSGLVTRRRLGESLPDCCISWD